ncbi:disulfide bond formation protein B [Streptomyces globosus]|uniref:disulfide bond formation protein B n=1 Tax=Streptomyces globosus TaxID=68209 RepID=UPI0038220713
MHSSMVPETPIEGGLLGRVQFWFACLFTAGWALVAAGGLLHQFATGVPPCPLCVVQRMCMLLAAAGAAYIVRTALMDGAVSGRDYMTGWGLALTALAAGSFASWRQAVLPGGRADGAAVLGLHPPVWAALLFQASGAAVGIVLALAHATADRAVPAAGPGRYRTAGAAVLWLLVLVTAVSLAAVFLQEGFHWFLADTPRRYEFFHDVRPGRLW